MEAATLVITLIGLILAATMEVRRSKLRKEYQEIKKIRDEQSRAILQEISGNLAQSLQSQNDHVRDLRALMERQMQRQEWTNRLVLAGLVALAVALLFS